MELSEGLQLWLGALLPPPHLGDARPEACPERAIFLGAGFTKASNSSAPLFGQYTNMVKEALNAGGILSTGLRAMVSQAKDSEITDLAELYHNFAGRRAVAELFMSEPVGWAPALAPGAYQAWSSPLPPRAEATYRTLEQWKSLVAIYHPLHLSALDPGGPPVVLGRMLAEGFLRQVLSTNWDSYVELGAWLVGLEVLHARERKAPDPGRQSLQVFDTGRDVSLYSRRKRAPLLLKLHSGVDVVARIMKRVSDGQMTQTQAEQQLRACFLVSSTDLTHWRDAAQWVQDVVADALRSQRVFFVGVSGADTVTYRAVRSRVLEWEQAARDWRDEHKGITPRDREPEPDPLPLVALVQNDALRAACMMSVQPPAGAPRIHTARVKAGGKFGLRAAYAWALLQKLVEAPDLALDSHVLPHSELHSELPPEQLSALAEELSARLTLEIDAGSQEKNPTEGPLLSLLCDALGPNARWAALAEGRPPFESLPLGAASRWWYAPWFHEVEGATPICKTSLHQLAACAAWLTRERDLEDDVTGPALSRIEVDPWTGVVALPRWKLPVQPSLDGADTRNTCCLESLSNCDLLLLPWPWKVRSGVLSPMMHHQLKRTLHWLPGRTLDWLASPRLHLLPVGDVKAEPLRVPRRPEHPSDDKDVAKRRRTLQCEIPLAAGWASLLDPIDWFELIPLAPKPP